MPVVTESVCKRKIVLAEIAGYCFGVRRAVEMAEQARAERSGRLTSLGPIIHNEQIISQMRESGIETEDSLDRIKDGTVILSAHGVSPFVLHSARRKRLDIVDVTCPFVTRVHRAAKKLYEEGYLVLLLGDAGHSEVKGVIGAVEAIGGSVTVVSSPDAANSLPLPKKVGVISQTTQRLRDYRALVSDVCGRATEVRAINTICGATDELQNAAWKMAREVDVAIVIGGTKSANTRRLRELCEEAGIPAYQVQSAADIQEEWLAGKQTIGITAGASTPDCQIEEVARGLNGGELPEDWGIKHPDG
jgi:small subunit ribosomal protein S1